MNGKRQIIDNFLDQDKFNELQNFFMGISLPWFYQPSIDSPDDVDQVEEVLTTIEKEEKSAISAIIMNTL